MGKNTFPDFVPLMMPNSVKEPFDSPDWIFEVKLDGYRGITVFDAAGKPRLWSRNGLPLEQKFPAVAKAESDRGRVRLFGEPVRQHCLGLQHRPHDRRPDACPKFAIRKGEHARDSSYVSVTTRRR